jgi:hypothetical protein
MAWGERRDDTHTWMGDCKAEDIPRNMFLGVALRYDIPARSGGTVQLETVLYGKAKVRHNGSVALRVTAVTKDSGYEVIAIVKNRMGEAIAQCVTQQSCGFIVLDIVEHFFSAFQSNASVSILIFPNFVIIRCKKRAKTAVNFYDNNSVWVCFSASIICGVHFSEPFKQRQRRADGHICKDIFGFVNREDIPRRCETATAGVALALRLGRGWPGRLRAAGSRWERLGAAGVGAWVKVAAGGWWPPGRGMGRRWQDGWERRLARRLAASWTLAASC